MSFFPPKRHRPHDSFPFFYSLFLIAIWSPIGVGPSVATRLPSVHDSRLQPRERQGGAQQRSWALSFSTLRTPEKQRRPKTNRSSRDSRSWMTTPPWHYLYDDLTISPISSRDTVGLNCHRIEHLQTTKPCKITGEKRRSSLRIFSVLIIARKLIEIEPSAPVFSLALISLSGCYRMAVPKKPSSSLHRC